jgi:hypothetical protein
MWSRPSYCLSSSIKLAGDLNPKISSWYSKNYNKASYLCSRLKNYNLTVLVTVNEVVPVVKISFGHHITSNYKLKFFGDSLEWQYVHLYLQIIKLHLKITLAKCGNFKPTWNMCREHCHKSCRQMTAPLNRVVFLICNMDLPERIYSCLL